MVAVMTAGTEQAAIFHVFFLNIDFTILQVGIKPYAMFWKINEC